MIEKYKTKFRYIFIQHTNIQLQIESAIPKIAIFNTQTTNNKVKKSVFISKYLPNRRIHLQFDYAFSCKQNKKTKKTFVNRIEPGIKKSNNLKLRCATSK